MKLIQILTVGLAIGAFYLGVYQISHNAFPFFILSPLVSGILNIGLCFLLLLKSEILLEPEKNVEK